MPQKTNLFVANWKMNMSFNTTCNFIAQNHEHLSALAMKCNGTIVLCPSFIALHTLTNFFQHTPIEIGAQNCSAHKNGAYTGEVDATSLHEIGCAYTIIGHSERRLYHGETDEMVVNKMEQLLGHAIQPIVCIGETKQQHEKQQTLAILATQVEPILQKIAEYHTLMHKYKNEITSSEQEFFYATIAYEPVWAIGTGMVPSLDHIKMVFDWLNAKSEQILPGLCRRLRFIYGGSVDEQNASQIMNINGLNGLLIGGASLDFQKFQNIVLSSHG